MIFPVADRERTSPAIEPGLAVSAASKGIANFWRGWWIGGQQIREALIPCRCGDLWWKTCAEEENQEKNRR